MLPHSLVINSSSKIDPTRTTGLRARFVRDMNRRFATLKKDIRISIVDNDCFGFRRLTTNAPVPDSFFAFMRDPEKVKAFMDWLRTQEAQGILTIIHRPFSGGIEGAWTDTYIQTAYAHGISRADAEMIRAKIDIPGVASGSGVSMAASQSFNLPMHADALGVLYSRTFEDLKSVTSVMNAAIQRTISDGLRSGLSQGMAQGLGPDQIARNLMKDVNNRVDAIGVNRARMIARTETIRAHHVANIEEYRRAQADMQVTVQGEWLAADDACDQCAELNGKIFSLDEIEGMLPYHPNCRCACAPYIESVSSEAA